MFRAAGAVLKKRLDNLFHLLFVSERWFPTSNLFNLMLRTWTAVRKMTTTLTKPNANNGKQIPLTYKIVAECPTTKARVGVMSLLHSDVDTPVFMPVGTQVRILEFFIFRKKILQYHNSIRLFFSGDAQRCFARPAD